MVGWGAGSVAAALPAEVPAWDQALGDPVSPRFWTLCHCKEAVTPEQYRRLSLP